MFRWNLNFVSCLCWSAPAIRAPLTTALLGKLLASQKKQPLRAVISTAKQSCNSQHASSFQQFFHKPLSSFMSVQQVLQATSGKSSFPLTASENKLWPDFCVGLKTGKSLLLLDFVVFNTSEAFFMAALTAAGWLCADGCSDQFCVEWLRFLIWWRLMWVWKTNFQKIYSMQWQLLSKNILNGINIAWSKRRWQHSCFSRAARIQQ